MDTLKKLFTDLKFDKVSTYIQTGNVVFNSREKDSEKLKKKIEKAI